jgi:hypothetical protein
MKLTKEQRKILNKCIAEAYKNKDELVALLKLEMDITFALIASGSTYTTEVFNLI